MVSWREGNEDRKESKADWEKEAENLEEKLMDSKKLEDRDLIEKNTEKETDRQLCGKVLSIICRRSLIIKMYVMVTHYLITVS